MLYLGKPKKREVFITYLLECGQWLTALIVLFGVICEYLYKADFYLLMITSGVFGWADREAERVNGVVEEAVEELTETGKLAPMVRPRNIFSASRKFKDIIVGFFDSVCK